MTEIPEHLLKRSKERRSAMGGGAPAGEGGEAAPAAAASAVPAKAAAAVPAAPAEPAAPKAPEPLPPYVEAAQKRRKMPLWAAPVVVGLPLWAIVYVGTLEAPTTEAAGLLAEGEVLYVESCAGCHGAGGGGGVGPQLSDGEVLLTFPDLPEMVTWVVQGSPAAGTPYGDPNRPGGGRVAKGGMPAFGDPWSNEEIVAVVLHERAALSGSEEDAALAAAFDEALAGGAEFGEDWTNETTLEEITAALEETGVMGEG